MPWLRVKEIKPPSRHVVLPCPLDSLASRKQSLLAGIATGRMAKRLLKIAQSRKQSLLAGIATRCGTMHAGDDNGTSRKQSLLAGIATSLEGVLVGTGHGSRGNKAS